MSNNDQNYVIPNEEKESDELFLDLIRDRPCLYDKTLKEYHDKLLIENAMEEIAFIMQDTVSNCEKKWQNFKASYTKERNLQELESRSGSDVSTRKKWIHFQKMKEIFANCDHSRQSFSNISASSDIQKTVNKQIIPPRINRKRKALNPVESALNKVHSTVTSMIQASFEENKAPASQDDDIAVLTGKIIAARLNQLSPTSAKKKRNSIMKCLIEDDSD